MQFDAGAAEKVRTPIGEFTAVKIGLSVFDDRNQPVGRNIAIWISEDARRLPVKLTADLPVGNFELLLREARFVRPRFDQRQREAVGLVDPLLDAAEPGALQHPHHLVRPVLVRALGPDRLAFARTSRRATRRECGRAGARAATRCISTRDSAAFHSA